MKDDRVTCHECLIIGRCNGPIRAEPDLLRRCEVFEPQRGAADRRNGAARFPTLAAERAVIQQEATRVRRETNQRGVERAKAAIA